MSASSLIPNPPLALVTGPAGDIGLGAACAPAVGDTEPSGRAAMLSRLLAAAIASALLAACTVGPDHVRPTLDTPGRFARDAGDVVPAGGAGADAPPVTGAIDRATMDGATMDRAKIDPEFWRGFGDPQLTRLVEDALASNHDLGVALARFDRANALLRGARVDLFPAVTASAGASNVRASADQQPGVGRDARDAASYEASLVAGWELDLFGRVRRGVQSQRAQAAATAADLHAMQVAVAGEVARSYLELRGLQEQLRVARANVANQRGTLRVVDARLQAGRGTPFDTARAQAQLETTLARLPALEAAAAVAMHRIAVLAGQPPHALVAQLQSPQALPAVPAPLDPGTPGDLLRRRPDVAAAERRLESATARIGVATADLYPRFTLGGLIGSQAVDADALFGRDSETRVVALGIDWSFLDVGRTRARLAAAQADADAALAAYRQSVLLALEDTENALVRHGRARVEDTHLQRSAQAATRAAQLARVRFDAGAADLLEVLDAERVQLQAQDAFAAGRTRSATTAVALYRSLAGGWPARPPLRESLSQSR